MSATNRTRLARFGEDQALLFLCRRGARLVDRNRRVGRDELDLIVRWPDRSWTVVEVKTRINAEPIEAFDDLKAAKVKRAAANLKPPVARIDFLGVRVMEDGIEIHWVPRIV